jgi:methionine synthase I (cobalamin-dependent)
MEKIALCQLGHLEQGDPVELGELCVDLGGRRIIKKVWGGCCGTWNSHLDEIAKKVIVT